MENIDEYICDEWNKTHLENKIVDEETWEFCRILMNAGLVEPNKSAVSVVSVGPFRIASKMKIEHKDVYEFLVDTLFPMIFYASNALTFDQVCTIYLIPAAKLIIHFLDKNYIIKDSLQWAVLLFIKKENACNRYPILADIERSEEFKGYEKEQLEEALMHLEKHQNLNKDTCSLIVIDNEGKIKSNV